jgi:subtilase family serine protease/N-acetylneuraminic acid mutarotase
MCDYSVISFPRSGVRLSLGFRGIKKLLPLSVLTLVFLFAGSAILAQTANQITHAVDIGQVRMLANHHPLWASPNNSAGLVPADQMLDQMTMVLARSAEQEQAFEQLLEDQQNPASPEYHHWLTPEEIGARFGLSGQDISTLTGWLQSQGLHVNWISPSRTFIGFGGTAADVNRAFQTELHYYNVNSVKRMSVSSDPTIPEALAPAIKSIRGLFTPDEQSMLHKTAVPEASPEYTSSTGAHYLMPGDFATIYDLPSDLTGAGQTIGIVSWSRTYFADFNNYRTKSGSTFPNPTEIIPFAYGGQDPGSAATNSSQESEGQDEATLDVTRAGSVAPGAKLLLVISSTSGTHDGLGSDTQYLVQTSPIPAQIITISFGGCEYYNGSSGVTYWDTLFKQAAAEGISVFVSSGDSGASGCDKSFSTPPSSPIANSPNAICSSSYATCVGGTEFNDSSNASSYWRSSNSTGWSSALSYIPEGGWNEPLSATSSLQVSGSGGGVSKYIPTPSWQTGTGVPSARAGRYTPDIAFSSASHDGYQVYYAAGGGSGLFTFAGTSAAAPSMAGIAALLDQKMGAAQGNLNPQLYQLASSAPTVFHDVTVATSGVTSCSINTPSMCNNSAPAPYGLSGGQAGYLVTAGYDEVTGLGSLDVTNFLNAWTNTATATPVFNPVAGTYTSKQNVTISDATSGAAIYYTIDGTVPTTSSTKYTTAISVSSTETIKAIAMSSGSLTSAVASATYTFNPAATPVFNPAAGTYANAQTVTISDSTAGATINYTTDGTTPTTSSTTYTGPITVSTAETVKAIASVSGYMTSAVASASYIIHPAAAPTFSLAGGLYSTVQTVAISDATAGATIYYTIDGSTPTSSSLKYTAPIMVSSSVTLNAIAMAQGYSPSPVSTVTYTVKLLAATPTFSVTPGSYTVGVTVAIGDSTPGVNIYYTTDGTTPTTRSSIYIAPLTISTPETIKAFATSSNNTDSAVATATYVIATGNWGWMSGSSIGNKSGVYGSRGVSASSNVPGGRDSASSWMDKSGNLWIFGGLGYDSAGGMDPLSDLWKYNHATNQWAWMTGSNEEDQIAVYGTQGVPASTNDPGNRQPGGSWTDKNGNFWLFGGNGFGAGRDEFGDWGVNGDFSDLWVFSPTTNQWTWMAGSSALNMGGVYGTLGVAAAGNGPGSRESTNTWTDNNGNLWLYGGMWSDSHGKTGLYSDLWKFTPSTNQWTWMGGDSTLGQSAVYGSKGVAAAGNTPGGRFGASTWTDKNGNLWLFSGGGASNAIWEYNTSTNQWAWMGGSNVGTLSANYGTLGIFADSNTPSNRTFAGTATDQNGNFWLFGGDNRLNDLWEYNPTKNQWAWMGGGNGASGLGVYGTQGVGAAGNLPSARGESNVWIDTDGNLWLFGGQGCDSTCTAGQHYMNDVWKYTPSSTSLPPTPLSAPTPTFSVAPGTYTTQQTVAITDTTAGATIYYTTDGTTPTTSSTVYSTPITVSSSETIEAIATATAYSTSAVATASYTIALPAATPTFSVTSGTYTTAFTVKISDATTGAVIYYTTDGTTPTTNSTVYSGAITVSSSETLEAIATASGYSTSDLASAAYVIANPAPVISFMSPAYATAGGAAFTLTVTGSGFTSSSAIYLGTSALTTQYVSATQLTAQVAATNIASAGTTAVTVQTPTPGGGTSSALQFEIDSSSSGTPSFSSAAATVAAGSSATYPVTLPSAASNVSVTCLNLPAGASCSYASNVVTITTSSTTPKGTYQITVVFNETVSGSSSGIFFSILLLPLLFVRRRLTKHGILFACLGLALIAGSAFSIGCGGGGGGSSTPVTPTNPTHQVTSSGTVSLTIQ